MLLLNISPLYLRCGVLVSKTDSLTNELQKNKLKYINPENIIDFDSNKLLLFQINYFKIEDFEKSPDIELLSKLNIILKVNQEENDSIEKILLNHKDSTEIISESRIKDNKIQECYYSGKLNGKNEYLIYKLFKKKCVKFGDITKLTVTGIDYVNHNLENSFYDLTKETIPNLVIVGENKNKSNLNKSNKNKKILKDKLYPYLLASGDDDISIYKVDSINSYKKIGNNTMGPTSLWSLLNLTGNYEDPELALNEATQGNNKLIDLSVGDIYGGDYGGASLCSDLIASSFSKVKNVDDINKINKKDVSKALLIFYGVTYAQVASMVAIGESIDKTIVSGDTFGSLELMQMIQTCLEGFTGNKIGAVFSDFSNYFEIIGMIIELEKSGLLKK